MEKSPNIIFIFGDEWRAQATGYNGDVNCETPNLDALASKSINLTHAVSGAPVCCPYRASLMTGQYPLTHGVYINDVELNPNCLSIANIFGENGYNSAYIGKWHLYGSPDGEYGRRSSIIPRDHQLGFDYWKGFECNHEYNNSPYFFNEDATERKWKGYDALAQSSEAANYIKQQSQQSENPFLLMLSWGPPHFPLHSAPEEYRNRYKDRNIELRPNVPDDDKKQATEDLRGYYAHIAALDDCLKIVLDAIQDAGIEDNTIIVFTSDHGDMFYSQGLTTKLYPWDESLRVPFLLRWPKLNDGVKKELALPIDAPDIMPTLLGLCSLGVPETIEGQDWSPYFRDECEITGDEAALISMPAEYHELRYHGIKAYRGLRTIRYTYVRNIDGPWLLYDNIDDPYQMNNLIENQDFEKIRADLDKRLQQRLDKQEDKFLEGEAYLQRDGLSHYHEANVNCSKQWQDPWTSNS